MGPEALSQYGPFGIFLAAVIAALVALAKWARDQVKAERDRATREEERNFKRMQQQELRLEAIVTRNLDAMERSTAAMITLTEQAATIARGVEALLRRGEREMERQLDAEAKDA